MEGDFPLDYTPGDDFTTFGLIIKLTDKMCRPDNQTRAGGAPCIMATTTPESVPRAAFGGTMMVLDGESPAHLKMASPRRQGQDQQPGVNLNQRFSPDI